MLKKYLFENFDSIRKVKFLITQNEVREAIFIFIFMLFSMVLEILGVGLILPLISILSDQNYLSEYSISTTLADYGLVTHSEIVVFVMLIAVLLYLIKASFLTFYNMRQFRFAFKVQAQLSQRLFKLYLMQPYVFHLKNNSSMLIRNATTEVNMFITNGLNPLMLLTAEFLILIGLGLMLFLIEPIGVATIVVTISVIGYFFHRYTHTNVSRWAEQRQYHEGLKFKHLQQGLAGAKDVNLLGREVQFLGEYKVHNFGNALASQMQQTVLALPRLWLEFIAVAALAMLLITMNYMGYESSKVLGLLALFAAAAFRLIPSFTRIFRALQTLRFGVPVIDTLYYEFSTLRQNEIENPKKTHCLPFEDNIRLNRVTYRYPDSKRDVLSGISLEIIKGESIGFIGSSGSGKSTLVDIVLGLLQPSSGSVQVDNNDISQNIRAWKNNVGYVPQVIYLTDDSLRNNIAFGLPPDQINEEKIHQALLAAQLEEYVKNLPKGLDTIVGERGAKMSGGQRQRIGIARALYNNPDVLVLDEATSALDVTTETDVMKSIYQLKQNKTVIIITHRLSTVSNCDRIYKIEQGEIVEQGDPNELITRMTL